MEVDFEKGAYRNSKDTSKTKGYISSCDSDSSDDCDSNSSDNGLFKRIEKRKISDDKTQDSLTERLQDKNDLRSKPKRNCVWTNVLQEQMLTDDVNFCGMEQRQKSRDVESYNFIQKEDCEKLAENIAFRLKEPKMYLIENTIKEIGPKKTMELFKKTMRIERTGGQLTVNKKRKRSPGGVFFKLLRSDPDVNHVQIQNIFREEKELLKQRKKVIKSHKRQRKYFQMKRQLKAEMDVEIASHNKSEALIISDVNSNICVKKNSDIEENSCNGMVEEEEELESGELRENDDSVKSDKITHSIEESKIDLCGGNTDRIETDDELEPGEIL